MMDHTPQRLEGRRTGKSDGRINVVLGTSFLWLWLFIGDASLAEYTGIAFPVPERTTLLILAGFFALALVAGRRSMSRNALIVPVIATLLYSTASAVWGSAGSSAFAVPFVVNNLHLLAAVILAWVLASADARTFTVTLALFSCVFGYAFVVLGLLTVGNIDDGRLAVLGGGPNVYARIAGMAFLALAYLVASGRLPRLFLALLPLPWLAVLLSGSRGGLIAVVFATAVGVIALWTGRFGSTRVFLGLVGLAATAYALLLATRIGNLALENVAYRIGDLTLAQGYDSGRREYFALAWSLFLDHPLIGVGLGGFSNVWGMQNYPHNLLLEMAVSTGLLGLLLLIFVLLRGVRIVWQRRTSLEVVFLGASSALYLAASMTSGSLYDSRYMWICLVGAASFPLRDQSPQDSREQRHG